MAADKGDAEEWVKGLNLHGENPPPVKENKPTGATPWLERVGVVNTFAETKYRIIHFGWYHNRGGEGKCLGRKLQRGSPVWPRGCCLSLRTDGTAARTTLPPPLHRSPCDGTP